MPAPVNLDADDPIDDDEDVCVCVFACACMHLKGLMLKFCGVSHAWAYRI